MTNVYLKHRNSVGKNQSSNQNKQNKTVVPLMPGETSLPTLFVAQLTIPTSEDQGSNPDI